MTELQLHPLCTLFPRLAGAELQSLRDDIAANGLRQPIVLHEGMILDGGNRYRACLEAGVRPTFAEFTGGSLVAFVLGANLHRRHMSAGQQAAIVASAQDWGKAQAVGGNGANQHTSKPATLPDSSRDTVADRAKQSGASERTQRMADSVARQAPELARQVAHGEISLPKAHKQVSPAPVIAPAAPKPEAKPARPKKGEPTIESLQAELEALRSELADTRANAAELAEMVESYECVTKGEEAAAKEMARLRGQLRTVEATRDQWMTTAGELRREVKSLQRKLGASQ